MALFPCPECGKEVSSSARTCPHCGCRLPGTKPTEIGELHRDRAVGALLFLCIVTLLLLGAAHLRSHPFQVMLLPVPVYLLIRKCTDRFFGVRLVHCPYCGAPKRMADTAPYAICRSCGKKSDRIGNYLYPRS